MKLDQLTYFLELARTQHVGQASKKLRLSPSAVSHALGQLEDELGAQLFDRIGRGLVLNDTGRRLAARAEAGRLCLCVRRDHPVFTSAAPTEALPRYPLAMPLGFQAEDMQDDPVLARFAAFHRAVAFGFDSYDVAAAFLCETDAVSILPDLALRTRGDRLTAVAVPGFDRAFEVVMLWPKARAGHPTIAAALAEARRVVATA